MDEIINELRALEHGWAGPNTKAPTKWLVENFKVVADRHLNAVRDPDCVEVDPDDGAITIRWMHENHGQGFTLVFQSRSKIIGVLSGMVNRTGYPPWRLPLEDSTSITEKLSHPLVNLLMTTNESERNQK